MAEFESAPELKTDQTNQIHKNQFYSTFTKAELVPEPAHCDQSRTLNLRQARNAEPELKPRNSPPKSPGRF